ncbi:MAG: ABC transporter permease [Ancrocorticia sp.]
MSLDMPTDVTGKLGVTRHRRRPISPSLIAGGFMVAVVVVVGIVAAFWTPYSLESTGDGGRLTGPSADFWLGTDKLGRDLFSQFISGATSALIVAVFTIIIAGILGLILGVVAAATVWWLDAGVSKVIDIMIAFPTLLLAMLVVTVRGASLSSAILAIGISGSAVIARVTRVNIARVLREDYIRAARTSGTGWWGIIRIHVIPNIYPMLLVQLMLLAGSAILAEASLSYLGLGAPPPVASWGRMLLEAQSTVLVQPIGALAPGFAIAWTVLGLNLLGDGIRDYTDPTLRGDR